MTASELADSAKEIHTTIEALEFVQKAIPLLRQQQAEIEALKDFAIWMTGCGYDFRQHIYFNECFDKLLRKEKEHE